jgi:hypothetical protein
MNNKDSHASALAAVLRRAAGLLLLFLATSSAALAADPALPRLRVTSADSGKGKYKKKAGYLVGIRDCRLIVDLVRFRLAPKQESPLLHDTNISVH